MADMNDIPEKLRSYSSIRANVLQEATRSHLGMYLNPLKDILTNDDRLQDWRGLAEELDYESIVVENWKMHLNPTTELLKDWVNRQDSTIGQLLIALRSIERFDILHNEKFAARLDKDVEAHRKRLAREAQEREAARHDPVQVAEVSDSASVLEVDEFRNITVNEVDSGVEEYFDAFVCYTSKDFSFVQEMMHKLEKVYNLKLCLTARDLLPGAANEVVIAKLIRDRCRKMIIILSPDYLTSPECDFQTKFAFALAPGAKEKKLIPVIVKPCKVPDILNFICLLDYTKCDVIDWFWERLAKSLKKDHVYKRPSPQRSSQPSAPRLQDQFAMRPLGSDQGYETNSSFLLTSCSSWSSFGCNSEDLTTSSELCYPDHFRQSESTGNLPDNARIYYESSLPRASQMTSQTSTASTCGSQISLNSSSEPMITDTESEGNMEMMSIRLPSAPLRNSPPTKSQKSLSSQKPRNNPFSGIPFLRNVKK